MIEVYIMPPLSPSLSSSSQSLVVTAMAPPLNKTETGIRKRTNKNNEHIIQYTQKQQTILSSTPSRAIAPIAIIGGTISVYSSAIKLSHNTDFTPLSMLYLFLLALNYAIMPRLSKRYIHPQTNKQSVALAEEIVKMSLGLGGWIMTSYVTANNDNNNLDTSLTTTTILSQELQNWSPSSTLIAAGLPSALYALQGTLTYTAYQNLDAVTFNGLTQLKVLSSALCCYLVLGRKQSIMQVISLGLLMMSTVVFQGSWKHWFVHKEKEKSTTTANIENNNRHLLLGVLPCLTATLLSGLAGAFSQRSLQKEVGRMHRNAYFYTIEISFLSAVCLMFSMSMDWFRRYKSGSTLVKNKDDCSQFWNHWTYATLLPIITKATAGLLTALVHRHLGSVIKGFALVLGLVFSALLQFALEGVDLSIGQLIGTALVLLSSWLHFTNAAG